MDPYRSVTQRVKQMEEPFGPVRVMGVMGVLEFKKFENYCCDAFRTFQKRDCFFFYSLDEYKDGMLSLDLHSMVLNLITNYL